MIKMSRRGRRSRDRQLKIWLDFYGKTFQLSFGLPIGFVCSLFLMFLKTEVDSHQLFFGILGTLAVVLALYEHFRSHFYERLERDYA